MYFTRLWRRQLDHYPATAPRAFYLGIVVLATIVLYYELYIQGAVATQIIAEYGMTLRYFVLVSIVGNAAGALASVVAGLADRWGRANMVVAGLLVTALIILAGLPNASSRLTYLVFFSVLSFVEGVVLVATPALIRDFSPQLGRASAMGFWTLGPVIGSLVVTTVSSNTLPSHPDWRFQFYVCGVIGLVVFVLALVGLRELSPGIRDQLMVSLRDRALVEARAAGIDPARAAAHSWRDMLRPDIVGSAFAVSVFLLFYYFAVGFFVIYYAIQFGYSEARANSLANWYWISNAIALVVVGVVSDRLRVRKPFMVAGGVVSAAGVAVFALLTTHPETGYYTFAWLLVVISAGGGVAYCAWMAAFTETVERHNPAATATGLAVWGSLLRVIVVLSLIGLILAVPSANALVDHGSKVQTLATKYASELGTAAKISPSTSDTLAREPGNQVVQAVAVAEIAGLPVTTVGAVLTTEQKYPDVSLAPPAEQQAVAQYGDRVNAAVGALTALGKVPAEDLAYLKEHGAAVQRAQQNAPHEWQRWWWVAFAGQVIFLPFVFLLAGRWSPRRAARDAAEHEAAVERELASIRG
ncbi:MFS transporter [Cryptosporangium phraense]|uniref:MFS transporter n=1 Tax=Cryptosporangium phraense TaxID=2593070 RepID=A0A545AG08_9ACTN|nr:MFS transporter [Cryptosporangium phraense]TQS40267.1 MFS transporter [Cryptosporangium phraense]